MPTPEEQAQEAIDQLLDVAGWRVQDREGLNLGAARGVAVREFPLSTGFADYLLFVDHKAVGVIEAKAEDTTLTGDGPVSLVLSRAVTLCAPEGPRARAMSPASQG